MHYCEYGSTSIQYKNKSTQTIEGVKKDEIGDRIITPSGRRFAGSPKLTTERGVQRPSDEEWEKLKKRKKTSEERNETAVGQKEAVICSIPWVLKEIDVPKKTQEEERNYRTNRTLPEVFGTLDPLNPRRSSEWVGSEEVQVVSVPDGPECSAIPERTLDYDFSDPLGLKRNIKTGAKEERKSTSDY